MADGRQRVLAIVVAMLFGAACFAAGVVVADGGGPSGRGGASSDGEGRAAGAAPSTDPATTGRTTFTAATPSVRVEATIGELERITVAGGAIEVPDGARPVTAPATVSGRGLRLTGIFNVSATAVTIDGRATVVGSGPLEVVSQQGARVYGRDEPATLGITGTGVPWTDAPPAMTFGTAGDARGTVSWSGGGHVVTAGGERVEAQHLGVKATALAVALQRGADGVALDGSGFATQVYADGLPRLPGRGFVEVKQQPAPVRAGARGSFTWAPTNRASTDLVILGVRAGSAHARWINLALDRLPAMCGVAPPACPVAGGNTADFAKGSSGFLGLGRARPINAVIVPGTGDERDVTFDVPAGTPPGRYELRVLFDSNAGELVAAIVVEVTA